MLSSYPRLLFYFTSSLVPFSLFQFVPFYEGGVQSGRSGMNVPGFWVTFQHDGRIERSQDNLVLV